MIRQLLRKPDELNDHRGEVMKVRKRYSLQTLIFTLTFFIVVGTSSVVSWFYFKESVRMLTQEFDRHAELLIRNFAYQAFESIVVQDPYLLEILCDGFLLEDKVMSASVYDHNQNLIYQIHNQGYRPLFAEQNNTKLEYRQADGNIQKDYQEKYLDIVKDVPDRPDSAKSIGYVRMGISLSGILEFKQQLIKKFIETLVFVLISGLFLTYFLVKNLTVQLEKVVRAMANIISGSGLAERIQDTGHIRETREIQTHFNTMMDKLSSSQTVLNNTIHELFQNREQLNLALEASEAGLWDWHIPSGKIIFNERLAQILGYRSKELEGHMSAWKKLLYPEDVERVMNGFRGLLKGEISLYRVENRMRCKDNSWVWIFGTGKVVIRDKKGKAVRVVGTVVNIQERKNIEVELCTHRENLEGLVKERTAELKKMQHELVNKAVEAGRAQISAMVLHNIGNAVTPVSVAVEKLMRSDLGTISRYLSKCYKELSDHRDDLTRYITRDARGREVAQYMGSLILGLETMQQKNSKMIKTVSAGVEYVGQILSLQRTYAPNKAETKERINLNDMVKDALKIQEDEIVRRDIELLIDLSTNLPIVLTEKNKLMQVLINFIKNSCDAIDENHEDKQHRIDVSTFRGKDQIVLRITDTGCGIESDLIDEIFEFGVSSKGSSGFGLYYCKSVIEACKGTLNLESEGKNRGVTMTIKLPVFQHKETN